jgi:hypothetical protein
MTVIAGDDLHAGPARTPEQTHIFEVPPGPQILIGLTLTPPAEHIAAQQIIGAKLYTLMSLRDGWLGAGSVAPRQRAFDHYVEFLVALGDAVNLDAEAVATGDGTLEVEWKTEEGERLIEFSDRGAWLLHSADEQELEVHVEPFDADQVRSFFLGDAI